ncbi:MAG: MarR family transcriptional regulator, partial [Acidimicrobiia bacterium]
WESFVRAHRFIASRVDAALQEAHHLSLMWFEALVQIDRADNPLRMHELADRLLLSRSAASRFVDRLEENGLVRRRLSQEDRRGMEVSLTPSGHERLGMARHTHARCVRAYFLDHLDEDGLDTLNSALSRVLEDSDGLMTQ